MKRTITIIIIFIFTITIGIIELVNVRQVLTSMEDIVGDLTIKYETNSDEITQFYDKICDVKTFWANKEKWLCFIFNHRDLSIITDSINRLQAYTKNNDYDNAIAELSLLTEYSTKSYHIMGFNIHNIL